VNSSLCVAVCLVASCLVFSPVPVAAAAEEVLFFPWLPLLLAATVLLGVALMLRLWYQRQVHDKDELTIRLQMAEQAVDRVPMPILCLDADFRVLAANQSALQTYSHTRSSLIGLSLLDLFPELAGHPDIAALHTTKEGREPSPVSAVPREQEEQRQAAVPGTLVSIAAGGRARMLWFGTVPAAGEYEERKSGDIASFAEESASRMKSEFIANINHEVRTPMNAIIGYTEMLANSQLGPKEKRFVAIIHKSSMALVSIFNDIMELSKIDSDRLHIMATPMRVQSIVNDVDGLFKDLVEEKGIRLNCRLADHLPECILFDGVRLKQILQNLVGNAIKFTHEGAVTLAVDGDFEVDKPGCLRLRFVVEDTGIGITEADQRKIVELFRRGQDVTTKHYGGVGLGLTLCSRLTAMMGGRIELVSREGEGTRFTLLFDGVPSIESVPALHEIPVGEPGHEERKKLLVVDDVDLIKDVFLDFFQGSPYRVLTANNGSEALTMARAEQPDLIFMDLNLTGIDGRSVTRQLREYPETAAIPVVVMTGDILEEADYRPLFDDFLQKPFRLEELQELVARYVGAASMPPAAPPAEGRDEDEQILARLGAEVWNAELESLRQQVVFSGSLCDAASLGMAMRQRGVAEEQPVLTRLGDELLHHAQEPNILGVDRLLAQLSRIANRTES